MRSRKEAQAACRSRRHVVRLAEEENLALDVRFSLDQRSDRAHRRREERAVRREAIGGSHGPPVRPDEAALKVSGLPARALVGSPAQRNERRAEIQPGREFLANPCK